MNLSVVHYYPRAWVGDGGCTAAVRGWASALADAGAEVTVVCDQEGEAPRESQVCWLSAPHRAWGRIRFPIGLEQILHGRDLLVLHSGWVYHNVQAARSAARSGVPYVLTPHGAYDPNVFKRRRRSKRLWWKVFEHQLVTRARAIHVFFEEQRDELRQLGYTGPVIIAPTGLTIPDFKTQVGRSEFLLWMGRFDIEIKGIDLLLHALASLPPSARPRARLHGPDWRGGKQQARQLVRELGLGDYVQIGPPLYGSEKWEALRGCGFFIFPSRWEGQGLMALEAAAAAAPLVVTSTTSVGRHLAAAQAAILVEPTVESIAAGIVRGYSSSDAGEFGARASQLVRERFSWPAVAESYAHQLRDLL
jgi:glycosyltransferase involved in cell wall biosynthesis